MKRVLAAFVLAAGLVAAAGAVAPVRAGAPIPEIGGAAVTSVAGVVSHITPGVVGISVRGEVREVNPLAQDPLFRQFFNLRDQPIERETEAVGSGVIVDAERGYVLTNSHVVDNATKIEVTTKDNRRFAAKLIGRDTATDIALLQIPAETLTAMPIGDSSRLQVGDFVLAVGNRSDWAKPLPRASSARSAAPGSASRATKISSRPMRRSTRAIRAVRLPICKGA